MDRDRSTDARWERQRLVQQHLLAQFEAGGQHLPSVRQLPRMYFAEKLDPRVESTLRRAGIATPASVPAAEAAVRQIENRAATAPVDISLGTYAGTTPVVDDIGPKVTGSLPDHGTLQVGTGLVSDLSGEGGDLAAILTEVTADPDIAADDFAGLRSRSAREGSRFDRDAGFGDGRRDFVRSTGARRKPSAPSPQQVLAERSAQQSQRGSSEMAL